MPLIGSKTLAKIHGDLLISFGRVLRCLGIRFRGQSITYLVLSTVRWMSLLGSGLMVRVSLNLCKFGCFFPVRVLSFVHFLLVCLPCAILFWINFQNTKMINTKKLNWSLISWRHNLSQYAHENRLLLLQSKLPRGRMLSHSTFSLQPFLGNLVLALKKLLVVRWQASALGVGSSDFNAGHLVVPNPDKR